MKTRTQSTLVVTALSLLLLAAPALWAQGHFEFSGHYGRWGLNFFGDVGTRIINDVTESNIRDKILSDIQNSYPGLGERNYTQAVRFDSRGDDFGFGIRFYPSWNGSFSLGVSVEKSTFKILPTIVSHLDLQDMNTQAQATFDGSASGSALVKATSFHLTFRWDIVPSAVVHPYITIGGGISTAKALDDSTLSYSYSGQLVGTGIPNQTIGGSETKTLRQLKDESDTKLPNFVPFLQLNTGLKAKILKNVHVLVETGFFDGFIVSGALAVRL